MEGKMGTASDMFMQEQQAKLEFTQAITRLRSCCDTANSPQFFTAFDATTEAALRFGTCELRIRRAERLDALGLAAAGAKRLKSTALSNNKLGLAALRGVRPFVDELANTRSTQEQLASWRKSSPDLRAEWREQISQVNVSAENARHLVRIMDECCEAIDKAGAAGLGQHLSATLDELEEQRRAPNRGTQEASFPWWKIVLAAIVLGLAAWSVYELITRGAPWWDFFLVALAATLMILVVALGC
ncbi:hypothetical protein JY651_13715 [Pyxidicoccus parkwayensis]|jgi:hypothetical protein|uniref:Uncharacterized protein n=1 Tax=Pyxidicoccus parkwayensis TaxID=2813578 RepID=A0ABX7P694_9BACT|nr:hypothetical protein [Pyxidicoccus parkwaysis]QSQ25917.1 hypothetical protein JY651_13715 [Pyxidicoccus parkwaysis]